MFAILSVALLSAIVDAGGHSWPSPPNFRGCSNITVNSTVNCPPKGYECNEDWGIKYKVSDEWSLPQVKCTEKNSKLAVAEKIVDRVLCRGKKWKAEGNCDIETTSVVCAKRCDASVCHAFLPNAPEGYANLTIRHAAVKSKCATAQCNYGFVALRSDGTLIREFPSTSEVSCSGDGKWAVLETEESYKYLACRIKSADCGGYVCNQHSETISFHKAKTILNRFENKMNRFFEEDQYDGLSNLFVDRSVAVRLPSEEFYIKKGGVAKLFFEIGNGEPMTWKTSHKILDLGTKHFVVNGNFELTLHDETTITGIFKQVIRMIGENWLLVYLELDYENSA